MSRIAFDWVDAFTDRAFGGNGCAVFHDAGHLDDDTCMAIVRETSLVECTFVEASDAADFKVRYFLASREIPFAGHPTLATAAALVDRGLVPGDRVTFETGAGIVPVDVVSRGAVPVCGMTQVAPSFHEALPRGLVAEVVGLAPEDIIGQPQVVSTGLPFCITVIDSAEALRRARLNLDALARFRAQVSHADADVMEPFLVTLNGATEAGDTFSRLLLAPPSPPEDPFTGSATGAMAAYLWHHGLIERPILTAEQGHWMDRPGQAQVEVLGPRDAPTGVRVAGPSKVLMRGEIEP